jgi:hypothetical protein
VQALCWLQRVVDKEDVFSSSLVFLAHCGGFWTGAPRLLEGNLARLKAGWWAFEKRARRLE